MSFAGAFARLEDDAAANAPEVDHSRRASIHAPEQIVSDGLQVKYDDDLEVGYSDSPQVKHNQDDPEVRCDDSPLESVDNLEKPLADPPATKRPIFKRKRFWITAIVLLAIAAAAVGIGLGVSLSKDKTNPSDTGSTLPPSATATSTPPSSGVPLERGIANGSSVATAVGLDLTKHIFFQDINGSIRQATQSGSEGDWDVSLNNVVATNARQSTPMAAFVRIYGGEPASPGQLYLLYVSSNNTLTWITFVPGVGWEPPTPMDFSKVEPFSLSATSRNFAAASIVNSNAVNSTNFGVLLMLHDSEENLLILYGFEDLDDTVSSIGGLVWNNITDRFFSDPEAAVTATVNCTFSNLAAANNTYYPFLACPPDQAKSDNGAWTYQQQPQTNATTLPSFRVQEYFPVASKAAVPIAGDQSVAVSIGPNTTVSDGASPKVYTLADDTLALDTGDIGPLSFGHDFPFTNIAAAAPAGTASPYYYVYHQINESTFAEETFNADTVTWNSKMVQVDVST